MSKVTKQKVSTVDGREVKFFDTRNEAREYNRKNGTVGVGDDLLYWYYSSFSSCIIRNKEDNNKRWFVFLDTNPSSKVPISLVDGKPVVFFATRNEARNFNYYQDKSGVKDLWNNAGNYTYSGNTNNYRWFVFL